MAQETGKFVWFECVTRDIARSKTYYGEVFGWKVQGFPMGDTSYDMITAAETPVGGYKAVEGKAPPHWESYLAVDDVDSALQRIQNAGGKVLQPAFDVPEVGRMAQVADPEGAIFWVMSGSGGEGNGDASSSAPGAFHWNELWARDGAKALAFYTKAFGFSHREMSMPDGVYRVLEKDGVPRAGIMTSPDEKVPPMWLPYVAVEDCDAALARAKKLGGSVHVPATDVPGVGRFAVFGDPQGATIALIKPAQQ